MDLQDVAGAEPESWAEIYWRLATDRNDSRAFAALKRRVAGWAARQLAYSPALRAQCDDIVAETCSAAVVGLVRAYGADTFAGFVYGHYLNARRRALQNARQPVVLLGDIDPPAPVESEPSGDELALLEDCLAGLLPRERRAVELRYLKDTSVAEIASALGVTEGNARRIVFNGLTRLRRSARETRPPGRG